MDHVHSQPLAFLLLALIVAAYLLGRHLERRRTPIVTESEHLRRRFENWLRHLWGIEERVWSNRGLHVMPIEDEPVPLGLEAPNVHADKQEGLLPWVLHTFNLAELRLVEISRQTTSRGYKYVEAEEAAFQRLLKDARYLRSLCEAAMYARSENYNHIRPAILEAMKRYPAYFPDPASAAEIKEWLVTYVVEGYEGSNTADVIGETEEAAIIDFNTRREAGWILPAPPVAVEIVSCIERQ